MTTTSDLAASVLMVLCGRVYVTHMRQDVLTCSLPTERRLLPLFADGRPAAGRTYLAHKAEHAVDLETGAIVGITVQDADEGDTTTSIETLIEAAEQVEAVRPDGQGIEDVVGDKGYHSNQSLVDLEAVGIRSCIAEPVGCVACASAATPTFESAC